MYNLEGQVAIITGAGGGIGREICLEFAKEKMIVIPTGRRSQNTEETMEMVRNIDPDNKGAAMVMDVTDSGTVQATVKKIIEKYGRIDALVNNAGIPHAFKPIVELEDEEMRRIMSINFMGAFYCTKYVGQQMCKQRSGNIVNIGSWTGKTPQKFFAIYAASKAALHIMEQTMAMEMGEYGVRVNSVCGGAIDGDRLESSFKNQSQANGLEYEDFNQSIHEMIPLQRFGTGEDVANLVLYLLSDKASYITAQNINVCGGIEFH